MEKFYHIYDFYIKGLDPDSIRHIMGEMNDLKNSFHDDIILKPENFVKNHDFSSKQYKRLYDIVYWEYENINRYLLKHQRKPFFDTNNLNECIKKRDEYLNFLKESECMERMQNRPAPGGGRFFGPPSVRRRRGFPRPGKS